MLWYGILPFLISFLESQVTPEEVVGPLRSPNLHHHPLKIADRPEPLRRAESRGALVEHRTRGAGLGVRVVQRASTGHSSRRNV